MECQKVEAGPESTGDALLLIWSSMGIGGDATDAYDIGSCFRLTPTHLITADHCLTGILQELHAGGAPQRRLGRFDFGMVAVEPPDWMSIWIGEVSRLPEIDVAWISIDFSDERARPLPEPATIRTTPVEIGERLRIVGFSNTRFERTAQSGVHGYPQIGLVSEAFIGVGEVTQHGETISGLLGDLEVIAGVAALPGMSGGPVYDDFGRCVGVVSRSMREGNYTRIATWEKIFKLRNVPENDVFRAEVAANDGLLFILNVDNRILG